HTPPSYRQAPSMGPKIRPIVPNRSPAKGLQTPSPPRANRRYSLVGIAFTSIPNRISILHFATSAGQSLLFGMAACQEALTKFNALPWPGLAAAEPAIARL